MIYQIVEMETCQRESQVARSGCRGVQALGEIITYLATKTKQYDCQPDVNRYTPKVLDFVARTGSATTK